MHEWILKNCPRRVYKWEFNKNRYINIIYRLYIVSVWNDFGFSVTAVCLQSETDGGSTTENQKKTRKDQVKLKMWLKSVECCCFNEMALGLFWLRHWFKLNMDFHWRGKKNRKMTDSLFLFNSTKLILCILLSWLYNMCAIIAPTTIG